MTNWAMLMPNMNFFNAGNYYTSAMNYDMISTNPWNSMNLHMNQLLDHSIAWSNMFSVPRYGFDNFMPYGSSYGNSWLTDPRYTLGQMTWGTPSWNNPQSLPWNTFGWNGMPFGTSSGTSTDNDNIDSATKRKYNKLLTLMKQLVKYEYLPEDNKDVLTDAINNAKGASKEEYEKLLKAYKEIDPEVVKEFLINGGLRLGVKSDSAVSEGDSDSFYNRLIKVGFEYNTKMDDNVDEFYESIKDLSDSNGTSEIAEGIIAQIHNGNLDILDFISSWNSNYKNDKNGSRVIKHIATYYNKIDDKKGENQKDDIKETILDPLVRELISKANSVKKSLDDETKDKFNTAIDTLREELNKTNNRINDSLSNAFDSLYLLTRIGATKILRNDIKAKYGDIDERVFNDTLFEDEILDDLTEEGFSDNQIKSAKVELNEQRSRTGRSRETDDNSKNDIDKKPAGEQIEYLKDKGVIKEIKTKKEPEITLYREANKTGDRDYYRLFYINDNGKLVEYVNMKCDEEGQVSEINTGDVVSENIVKPSEIEDAAEKVTTKKTEHRERTTLDYSAKQAGIDVGELLTKAITNKDQQRRIASKLNNLTEDNIYAFLEGFYSKVPTNKAEGLLEYLDDDCKDDIITIEMKKNIIECVLEMAKENGVDASNAYNKLKDLYAEWTESYSDSNNFKQHRDSWWKHKDRYCSLMDDQIALLFNEVKAKKNTTNEA